MPRFVFLSFFFLFSCLLFGCEQGTTQEKQKIGVVNINRIMVDSKAGRAAAKYIEGVQDSLRAQLVELQGKAEADEAGKKKVNEEEIQRKVQAAYGKLQTEQQNVQNILNAVLHRTVEAYRKEKGYAMILFSDVVLSFEEHVDVTSDITAALDKEAVEFKPTAELENPKAPADETKPETSQKSSVKEQEAAPATKTSPGTAPKK